MVRVSLLWLALCLALTSGCRAKPDGPAPEAAPTTSTSSAATVDKIVFIDMLEACECTTKRTEDSWAELQKATDGLTIPVQRIHMDQEDEEASRYSDMKPYVAIPAVYFLDGEGNLAGLLQGEITQKQFEDVISGAASAP